MQNVSPLFAGMILTKARLSPTGGGARFTAMGGGCRIKDKEPTMRDLIERIEAATGPDRFWSKVDRPDSESCWTWRASLSPKGYGQFSVGSKSAKTYRMMKSHRYAYEAMIGPIPSGLDLDHLCRNKACCNPLHLEPVTSAENNRRKALATSACFRGHPFTPENTCKGRNDTRECRTCRRDRKRKYRNASKSC